MTVEKYDFFELKLANGVEHATFTNGSRKYEIKGYSIGNGEFAFRFMPEEEGRWEYIAGKSTGEFTCVKNTGNNHGPVVAKGLNFSYKDGSPFFPVGTTCYAWIHQKTELTEQTLNSLATAPFNKIRMCVFPKHMPFNNNDSDLYPFEKNSDGKWDVKKPDFRFWEHLENNISKLRYLGIEADLILFHPYDRWGFMEISHEDCLTYLDYCIRRLSAFRNIWWSLANEYELVYTKEIEDWDEYGRKLNENDTYGHLISIHNIMPLYPKTDWMTHVSVQHRDVKRTLMWRNQYDLPVIVDECGYEGNIEFDWGNLSAHEMVHRAWLAVANGGFITHGETFWREDEVLWWAKGGRLYGQSHDRFAFLKQIQYEIGHISTPAGIYGNLSDPNALSNSSYGPKAAAFGKALSRMAVDERNLQIANMSPSIIVNANYRLHYLGIECNAYKNLKLPAKGEYDVEIIDTWDMTRTLALSKVCGENRIELPGKEGIAILIKRVSGDALHENEQQWIR